MRTPAVPNGRRLEPVFYGQESLLGMLKTEQHHRTLNGGYGGYMQPTGYMQPFLNALWEFQYPADRYIFHSISRS